MEKIEVLLKKDLSSSFDTRKMLNRSRLGIDQSVIDSLEAGEFTCEAIDLLSAKFPIFKYRTCITIHGNWPEISRTRIGGYKNVHQNLNGSVEVRYSAIDTDKVYQVAKTLRACESNFRYQENSNERGFYWMHQITSKDELLQASELMKPIAEKLTSLRLYGHVSLFTAKDFFRQFLVLAVIPLALPLTMVNELECQLTGLDRAQIDAKVKEAQDKETAEKLARDERAQAYAIEAKEKKERILARANDLRPSIAHLSECTDIHAGTIVKIFYDQASDKVKFVYYRKTGAGAFGRIKWQKAFSDSFTHDLDALKWIDQKQRLTHEFKLAEFRLVQRAQTKRAA